MGANLNLIVLIVLYVCVKESYGLVNGLNITSGQFSPHVVIGLSDEKQCGGVLINTGHVLTASSCVFDMKNELIAPNSLTISAKWNRTDGALLPDITNLTVMAIYAHPHFNPYSKENDIAVLRLSTPLQLESDNLLPGLAAANLNFRIVADKTSCMLAGFAENNTDAGLLYVRLPIFNRINCNTNKQYAFQIKDGMICAIGSTTTGAAVCESDIGSGLYCGGMLSGILSFGAACSLEYPGVYTQTRMYNQWIREQIQRTDIPRAGPTPPPSNRAPEIAVGNLICLFMVFVFNYFIIF